MRLTSGTSHALFCNRLWPQIQSKNPRIFQLQRESPKIICQIQLQKSILPSYVDHSFSKLQNLESFWCKISLKGMHRRGKQEEAGVHKTWKTSLAICPPKAMNGDARYHPSEVFGQSIWRIPSLVAPYARYCDTIAAIPHIARYFLRGANAPPNWCDTPPWYLVSDRHISVIPHFATYRAIIMRYPTKTSAKEFCDNIATSIARYENLEGLRHTN